MNTRRWMLAHVIGTIIGIGVGVFVMNAFFGYLNEVLGLQWASGLPADNRWLSTQIRAACLGGLVGGIVGDTIIQLIAKMRLSLLEILLFGVSGLVGWVLVPALGMVGVFVVLIVINPIWNWIGLSNRSWELYSAVTLFVTLELIPGIILGLALGWIRLRLNRRKMLPEPGGSR